MTVSDALALARDLKHGPCCKPEAPLPNIDEAIVLIREARSGCGFNWLTGEAAEEVLTHAHKEVDRCTRQR